MGFSIYLFVQGKEGTAEFVMIFLFLLFFGLGLPNVLSGIFYKIVTDEKSIKQRTIFNRWKSLKWSEVETVSYYETNKDLLVKEKGITIRCNVLLAGFSELAQQISDRTEKPLSFLKG